MWELSPIDSVLQVQVHGSYEVSPVRKGVRTLYRTTKTGGIQFSSLRFLQSNSSCRQEFELTRGLIGPFEFRTHLETHEVLSLEFCVTTHFIFQRFTVYSTISRWGNGVGWVKTYKGGPYEYILTFINLSNVWFY